MKKRLSVFFVLSLLLGCAGCGGAVPDSSALPYESAVQSGQTEEYRQDIFAFDAECYFVKCQDAGYLYLFPRREMSIMLCLRMTICSGRTRIQSFRRMYCTLLNWTRRKAV